MSKQISPTGVVFGAVGNMSRSEGTVLENESIDLSGYVPYDSGTNNQVTLVTPGTNQNGFYV